MDIADDFTEHLKDQFLSTRCSLWDIRENIRTETSVYLPS